MSRRQNLLRIHVTGRGWLRAAPTAQLTGQLMPRFTDSKRLAREYGSIRSAVQMAKRMEPFARLAMGETVVARIWHDDVITEVVHKRKRREE